MKSLRDLLRAPNYNNEKFIIFTEHRDTAIFLIRRLEGLGFTGRIAMIHGGMPYQERERQVEFFRRPTAENGANYLVATDAAGEGINLQFCWLMVNYDIPWNPARLEQRMGRIHRYGQKHDPVIIVNLVAGNTREGRVMKTLLDKLDTIRRQLGSDKVFDVIGRLFEDVPMRNYFEQAVAGEDNEAIRAHRRQPDKRTAHCPQRQGTFALRGRGRGSSRTAPPARAGQVGRLSTAHSRLRPSICPKDGAAARPADRGGPGGYLCAGPYPTPCARSPAHCI